jgi:hypothetical protein
MIQSALALREPQTLRELARATHSIEMSLRQALNRMVITRKIVQRKGKLSEAGRRITLYARTMDAFSGVIAAEQEAAAADEAIPG